MSNYTKSTNFTAKDSLPTGDTNKVVRGSEFDTEFNALSTAIATKADLAGPTFTGTATFADITATGTIDLTSGSVTTNIDGGTVDGVTIGGSTPGAGTFSSLTATTADINAGTVDNTVIGGATPAAGTFTAVAGTTGTFSGAVSGTTGTFSGAVTGSNLNVSNWDTAFGWGNHASAGYLTSVAFSDLDAGAVTLSSETFSDVDTQVPTNAAIIDYVAATIPLITEVNDLSASVTWANVPDANITQSSVTQHQAALSIAGTQLTGNISVPGNVYLAPSGTGYTELRGNTNAGAIRFNCESNNHGVTIKGPPHSATATYELELPNADGTSGQFMKTDGSGKLSFASVDTSTLVDENHTGDVNITGELLVDSYNETFKKVSSAVTGSTGYQLASGAYSQNFSVSSQESDPQGLAFNTDGTKMFVVGTSGDDVNEYALSTGFDVSTASYSQNFSVSSQETNPSAIAFNTNGTKMFVIGYTNANVNEYALTTGFDISTASYTQNFSVSSQESNTFGLTFNNDGTKMYVCGSIGDDINEYTLTTGFNVSTASYTRNFSVSAQETTPTGVAFNSDGTKMYISGKTGDDVNEYTLSTGFNVSTASYTQNFSVSSQTTSPSDVVFNSDGTKMYIISESGSVYEYTTSTSNYSTTFDCENANVFETELDANTTVVFSNPPASGTPAVSYYQIGSASHTAEFVVSSQELTPTDLAFNADGTKMFVVGSTDDEVNEYALSTGFDISTASFTQNFSVASQDTQPEGITFNNDGTKMFVLGNSGRDVNEYALTTGFDISTASYTQNFSVASQETAPEGITFNNDGTKMFIVGRTDDEVNEYALTTGFDISTASYTQNFSVASEDLVPTGLAFNSDGTKMFVIGRTNDSVYEYTLTTGFDISTASYSSTSFSVASKEASPTGIRFSSDGAKMFIIGYSSRKVHEYATTSSSLNDSTAYAMSLKVIQDASASGYTVTWPTSVDWPSATAPTLTATASAVDQFVFYTYTGGTTWYGFTAGQALG